jgi:predicted Ser/Thr protein kinase
MATNKIGHYTIVSELGRGGMGVVYLAHEESLNRYVAIKVLGEQLSSDPTFVTRFVREAQAAAALSHPNIIQIFFIGEDAGRNYFVMEYVRGKSLLNMVRDEGRIDGPRAARYVLQAANGLAAAHDRGFLHRDIKPANLLVDERGLVKIADFGLALPQDAATRLTAAGMLVGTPGYLSPEQCMGKPLDLRTDIYSLGVTYYEILTGSMPFQADSPMALLHKILQEEPPDISTLNRDVDEDTRRIVHRMIAKDREQRYASCHEVVADLEKCIAGAGGQVGVGGVAGVVGSGAEGRTVRMQDSGAPPAVPVQTKPVDVTPEAPPVEVATSAPPFPSVPAAVAAPSALVPAPEVLPVPAAAPATAQRSRAPLVILALVVVFVAVVAAAGFFALRSPLVQRFFPWRSAAHTVQTGETSASKAVAATAENTGSTEVVGSAKTTAESQAAGGENAVPAAPAAAEGTLAGAVGGAAGQERHAAADTRAAPEPAPAQGVARVSEGTRGGPAASGEVTAEAAPSRGGAETAAPVLRGVAVGAVGEQPIAGTVSSFLESELQGAGLQPLDAATLPETGDLFGGAGEPRIRSLISALRAEGVAVLVLARVERVGERVLNYMDRSDVAYTSRVTLTCFDVATGRAKGRSLAATVEYTTLNVEQATAKALNPLIPEITELAH